MNIYINNDTDYNLDKYYDAMREACAKALVSDNSEIKAEIGITFVTGEVIRELNRVYRGMDKVTDVLSFPADTDPEGRLYGDIFICFDQAVHQADEIGNNPEREIMFLTVHGTLHLLGYDHFDKPSEEQMIKKQKEIIKNLP